MSASPSISWGPQHGHVVPHQERSQPLVQVALHYSVLAVRGAGELACLMANHLEGLGAELEKVSEPGN